MPFELFCKNYQMLGETIIMNTKKMEERASQKLDDPSKLAILTAPSELSLEAQEELDRLNNWRHTDWSQRMLNEVLCAAIVSGNPFLQ